LHLIIKKAIAYLTDQIDEETAHMLVDEAKNDFPDIYNKYKACLNENNFSQAKEEIHALKGIMGAIGLEEEVGIIIKIEKILLDRVASKELLLLDEELSTIIDIFKNY